MSWNILAGLRGWVCLVLLPVVGSTQQKPTQQKPAQQQPAHQSPIPKADRDRAVALLRRHGERCNSVAVLVADYVQRRTTTLSKKPLLSSGSFLFVKQPAAVVFRAQKPRSSVVRLTTELYEVFRPRRKRLERFHLAGPELSRGLFAAVSGDAEQLLKDFDIAGITSKQVEGPDGGAAVVSIRLVPKLEATRKRLRELIVTLRPAHKGDAGILLRAVSYRDHSGDSVAIELRKLRVNPKDAPTIAFDVPKDTRILEHKAGR